MTEGVNVEFQCEGRGVPTPVWELAVDLTYIPQTHQGEQDSGTVHHGEQDSGTVVRIYNKHNVQQSDKRRYWCVGIGFLVNPPFGKRIVSDMTYIDLIVLRELFGIITITLITTEHSHTHTLPLQ